jgi:amino acid transporter
MAGKMAEKRHEGGVSYHIPGGDYFTKRELRRHAGVFSLWALGVGAVISGDFSGWNLGFAVGGWGGMFVATIVITIMYLGLTYSIAEMSPALPHTGGAYSFARTAFGPWGGFITGIAENIEYVLTPAVIVFFIGSYLFHQRDSDLRFRQICDEYRRRSGDGRRSGTAGGQWAVPAVRRIRRSRCAALCSVAVPGH